MDLALAALFSGKTWLVVLIALGVLLALATSATLVVRARVRHPRRPALSPEPRPDDAPPAPGASVSPPPFDVERALSIPSPSRPPSRHPFVLVHGYFGFDAIGVSRVRREYFRGVRAALVAMGYEVHVVRVPTAAGIELRAAQLSRQIRKLSAERVNVIAHSMGGLDARFAIAKLGLADRVASLTTVGTPHRGTPVADRSTRFLGEWRRARRVLHAIGANVDGLYDLTTRRMEEFNLAVPDAEGVTYASVVGALPAERREVHALLAPGHAYLARLAGPNDGLVPAASQRWGRVLAEVEADHWAQIGWSGGFDAARFYAAIAVHLAELGH